MILRCTSNKVVCKDKCPCFKNTYHNGKSKGHITSQLYP